ncbi:MAG: hypothetical protein M3P49_08970 [Actinomycetota bacterium]|nr:hypothetical protein [Actinomycetota bacterium]
MKVFADALGESAHEEYKRWKERHESDGYVINRRSRSEAVLHRAGCGHLTDDFGPGVTVSLTAKPKYCSTDRRELERWAHDNPNKELKRCGSCM